jgi:hypothetical protein
MVPIFFYPYAAKATIEHEFDTDHLNIWLTFPLSMNQNVKPANSKWIPSLDGIEKIVSTASWQDDYTLLLVVSGISALPDRVLLKYNGPGPTVWQSDDPARETLEISWHKQYEPWGPILSLNITT